MRYRVRLLLGALFTCKCLPFLLDGGMILVAYLLWVAPFCSIEKVAAI